MLSLVVLRVNRKKGGCWPIKIHLLPLKFVKGQSRPVTNYPQVQNLLHLAVADSDCHFMRLFSALESRGSRSADTSKNGNRDHEKQFASRLNLATFLHSIG
jgi:hypothetical protein